MGVYAGEVLLVTVEDGRQIEVEVAGPPDGVPLFVHHGTPGAAGDFAPLVELEAERSLRHVKFSRPGYGTSGRLRGRTVASCAHDVAAIADALGCERFYSIGASGGGPHSIACAALLPERVIAAAAIASLGPYGADGLDWSAGMGQENVDELTAALAGEEQLHDFLERHAREMRGVSADQIMDAFGQLVSDVDRHVVTGAFAEFVERETTRSLEHGVWGWVDDDLALFADWGFDLAEVGAPLSIWHGAHDRFVPIAHGEWLAAHTRAKVHLRPDDGHLSLGIGSYGEILDDLLAG